MVLTPYAAADEAAVIDLWKRCDLTRPWNDPRKDIQRKLSEQPELAVAPEHQKKGFGRLLMEQVESLLLARGCPKVNIQVRSTNAAALEFYRKIGYATDNVVSLGKRLIPDTPY